MNTDTPKTHSTWAELDEKWGNKPWVLLKHKDNNKLKPFHLEPEERYKSQLPLNKAYELVGTYPTMLEAVEAYKTIRGIKVFVE